MPELSLQWTAVLLLAVGLIAVLYSSVGHGGATGYLALMALLGVSAGFARPGALWLNCFVASIAFVRFKKAGHFDWSLFVPLASASIPMAWLGSQIVLQKVVFGYVLGTVLLAAGCTLIWKSRQAPEKTERQAPLSILVVTGGLLGFLAGLTGIGGGVFLTPLVIFLGWAPAKTAAGISALFILVNSVTGLIGLGTRALIWDTVFMMAVGIGIAGALFGSLLGARHWTGVHLNRALAIVLWIAAAKLFLTGS